MGEGPTKQPHRPWISHDFIQVFASCFGIFLHPASFRHFCLFCAHSGSKLQCFKDMGLTTLYWGVSGNTCFQTQSLCFDASNQVRHLGKRLRQSAVKVSFHCFDGRLLVRIGCWCFFLQFRWAPGKHISAVQVVMFFWQDLIVVCPFVASSSALRAYIVAKFISSLTWIVCANGTPLRSWTQEIAFRWTCQMHNYRSKRLKFSIEWRAPGGCRSMVREYNPPVPNGNKTNITFQSWSKQLCETISLTSLP